MADSIESQEHFMKAIKHLNAAKIEIAKGSQHESNASSWDYVYQPIDKTLLDIVKRSRI